MAVPATDEASAYEVLADSTFDIALPLPVPKAKHRSIEPPESCPSTLPFFVACP